MALTLAFRGLDEVKGPYQGNPASAPYHIFRGTLNVAGTYATGGNQYDLCTFFTGPTFVVGSSPQGGRYGVTAIAVNWVKAFGDYFDGTVSATAQDSSIALASGGSATPISAASTNNLATIKLSNGANGATGSEITNATALAGDFGILFAANLTFASAGLA